MEQFLTTFVSEYDENSTEKYQAMLVRIAIDGSYFISYALINCVRSWWREGIWVEGLVLNRWGIWSYSLGIVYAWICMW